MKESSGEQKGFTLIELSIVLVIIGIILAAVLKGQDLLVNAKTKQFTSNLQAWQIAVNNFTDFTKRFPGDQNNDGIIGNVSSDNVSTDMAVLSNPPAKQFTLGVNSYYVFLGNDGNTPPKNILLVCVSTTCGSNFNQEEIKMAASFASTTDGVDDVRGPYNGGNPNSRVYGVTSVGGTINATTETANLTGATVAGAVSGSYSWLLHTGATNGDIVGLVYLFQ